MKFNTLVSPLFNCISKNEKWKKLFNLCKKYTVEILIRNNDWSCILASDARSTTVRKTKKRLRKGLSDVYYQHRLGLWIGKMLLYEIMTHHQVASKKCDDSFLLHVAVPASQIWLQWVKWLSLWIGGCRSNSQNFLIPSLIFSTNTFSLSRNSRLIGIIP